MASEKLPLTTSPRQPPARVRLRRINADFAKCYPPAGDLRQWWDRLKAALDAVDGSSTGT
jgi:hypothetical protein